MSSTGAQVTGGWSLLAGLLAALALAGCGPTAEIETYETPRGERLRPLTLGDLRASLDHMFAAVAPAGQQAWFFKMVVPAAAADELRQPFLDFLATVDVEAVGDKLPAWRVPDGWRPGAPRAMVDATFVVPYPGGEAELTVSSLPMGENWSEYLHQNVERWLGQLQQEALDGPTVEKLARTTPTAAGEATWFELVGTMQTSSGGAGGGAGLPADHPPIDGTAGAGVDATAAAESDAEVRPGSSGGLTYDAPADWKPGPASSMRKASFIVGAGGDLSVTTFPAHAQMADPRANAERWAGQVKLRNLTDEDLEAASRPVEVDGIAGQRFEFYSPAGVEPAEGLIAAMVVQGDLVWFFKLSGDRAVVEGQSEAFDRFLESVRLPAGS